MATQKEIEEIKDRVRIYDIISAYIPLKKSGNVYFGLCPFHTERTPSFSVNDDLGIYKCFGCQESGDIFTFLEKIENVTFPEAVEKLAGMSGTIITKGQGQASQDPSERQEILRMNALALDLFRYLLTSHTIGERARKYLLERNITMQSADIFMLGYDHQDTVVRLLRKRGFSETQIIAYGLGVERGGQLIDKYRGRIIFPIYSLTGEIIGFSGRILDDTEKAPKYLNSPETELFKKNNVLYGLHQTKTIIKQKNAVILLEGPIDVISAFQHGVCNVCAVQGTSLTTHHLQLLKRLTPNVIFCFDQDKAGGIALKKSYFLAIEAGVIPKVIQLTNAKDVDEKANKDEAGFHEEMKASLDIVEYIMKRALQEGNMKTADGRTTLKDELKPFIEATPDMLKKNFYIRELASLLEEPENILFSEFHLSPTMQEAPQKDMIAKKKVSYIRSKYILTLFLQYFEKVPDLIMEFDATWMETPTMEKIVIALQQATDIAMDIREFIDSLDEEDKRRCLYLMTNQEGQNISDNIDAVREEITITSKMLQKLKITRKLTELRQQLWAFEKEKKDDAANAVLQEISFLMREQQALKDLERNLKKQAS